MARQRPVYHRDDLVPPPPLARAASQADVETVQRYLDEDSQWAVAAYVFHAACRPPGFEGHGGAIPEAAKRQPERVALVRLLVAHGADPSLCNRRKVTPLHTACRFDLPLVVRALVELGAKIDAYDAARETPIYRAIHLGYADCLAELLAAGADLGFANKRGLTPLHRAVMRGKRALVPMLLAAGADPTRTCAAGKTPRDYCRNKVIAAALDAHA